MTTEIYMGTPRNRIFFFTTFGYKILWLDLLSQWTDTNSRREVGGPLIKKEVILLVMLLMLLGLDHIRITVLFVLQ
jgi:hypothetical protein